MKGPTGNCINKLAPDLRRIDPTPSLFLICDRFLYDALSFDCCLRPTNYCALKNICPKLRKILEAVGIGSFRFQFLRHLSPRLEKPAMNRHRTRKWIEIKYRQKDLK